MAQDMHKLVVRLEAQSGKLQAELDRANKKLSRFDKKARQTGRMLSTGLKAAFAAFSVRAFVGQINRAIQAGDQLGKLSTRLGESTEALSQLQFVADRTGLSFRTMAMGMQRATRRISEAAQGTGEAKDAIKELGLSAELLNDLSPANQLEVLADAFAKVEKPADRVRLAMKLFDSEGVALLQTLEGGSAQIRKLRGEADKLGLTLDKAGAQKLARTNDQLAVAKALFNAAAREIAVNLGPAIVQLVKWFRDLTGAVVEDTTVVAEWFAAWRTGQVSFWEWLTTGSDGAKKRLAQLKKEMGLTTEATEGFNFAARSVGINLETVAASGKKAGDALDGAGTMMDSHVEAWERHNELLEEGAQVYEDTRTPAERLQQRLVRLNMLLEEGAISWDTYSRAVFDAQDRFDELEKKTKDSTGKMTEFTAEAARRMEGHMSDFFFDAMNGKFNDLVGSFKRTLDRMVADLLASQLLNTVLGGVKSSNFMGLGGMASDLLTRRASGGPVTPGRGYLVGENGPEPFFPAQPGVILPTGSMGGTTVNNYVSVQAPNGRVDEKSLRQLQSRIGRETQRATSRNS